MRLCLMNYKDAVTHPINTKLTKAQLVEISKRLQVECLANELTTPLIPFNKYIKDVRTRWDIHQRETRALVKDVINLGRSTRQTLAAAMERL